MSQPNDQPAPHYVTCQCKNCGGGIEFPDEGLGQEIPCPHCGKLIRLQKQSSRLTFITVSIIVSVVIGMVTTAFIVISKHAGNPRLSATQNSEEMTSESKTGSVQNAQAALIAKAEDSTEAA